MATTNITVRIEDSLLDQVDEYCKKNAIDFDISEEIN